MYPSLANCNVATNFVDHRVSLGISSIIYLSSFRLVVAVLARSLSAQTKYPNSSRSSFPATARETYSVVRMGSDKVGMAVDKPEESEDRE